MESNKSTLKRIKDEVKDSYNFFSENYKRFNFFTRFVSQSSITEKEILANQVLQRPMLEFNILDSRISRLLGEFFKQEPSMALRSLNSSEQISPQYIEFLEGHLRAMLVESNKDNFAYQVYKDILIGGFSVAKVFTDYTNPMSFNQNIYHKRVYDPTLAGFDKFSRESHKGDGRYCFELFPMSRMEFEDKYGKEATANMKFVKDAGFGEFNWSYCTDENEIVIVCHFYEKKRRKTKIVQVIDGKVMELKKYEQVLEQWSLQSNVMMPPPGIVGAPRETEIVSIERYEIAQDTILDKIAMPDYEYLPLVFFDGNSALIRKNDTGAFTQLTRPYIYNAIGIQRFKNLAGNCWVNELENMMQTKIMICQEALPSEKDYVEAYTTPQKGSVMVYNAFSRDNPQTPLPPPQVIPRQPAPPEIMQAFSVTDDVTQSILGNYDASLGINDNQLSGKAIFNGATNANAASMPYMVGYLQGLNQIGKIELSLMPHYYNTPRTLPVVDVKGKHQYMPVNSPNTPSMDFEPKDLELKVEAGVNFEIQKMQSVETLINLMKVSPLIAEYMGEEQGITTLLDNIDIRGIDGLKQGVKEFIQKRDQNMAAKAQEEKQMMLMTNPGVIAIKQLEQKENADLRTAKLAAAKLSIDEEKAQTERISAFAKVNQQEAELQLKQSEVQAENTRSAVDYAIKEMNTHHQTAMDLLNLEQVTREK